MTVSGADVGEGYTLTISPDEIKIEGKGVAGAFYGIQTLKQIFEETSVPCLEIEDEPDRIHRGFYHDITRGKVPTVETLKSLIDEMAYYKMNELQLYIEHTFPFKEFGDDVEKFGGYDRKRVSNTAEFLKRYRESWMKVNKESELYRLEKLFSDLDAM